MRTLRLSILSAFFVLTASAQTKKRLLDHPMVINSISMVLNADCFTASTHVEIEFYNPNDEEIEGLFQFSLEPGQIVTAFQLDINGKYRDGSVEEKWKARNAYNTIVGKRIDPGLLSKEYNDNYRLNIYPLLAKDTRKVTMTILQQLKEDDHGLTYRFGFNNAANAKSFKVAIQSTGCGKPVISGNISNEFFVELGNNYILNKDLGSVSLKHSVSFYYPMSNALQLCTQIKEKQMYFAARFQHNFPTKSKIDPKKLLVYWDISGSGVKRNIVKEISFLRRYIKRHSIEKLTILAFNEDVSMPRPFAPGLSNDWIAYLNSFEYDGATRIDNIDFADTVHDAILLFTDGDISFGNASNLITHKPLYAISSSKSESIFLSRLVNPSGGAFIDLLSRSIETAIELSSYSNNYLLSVESLNQKSVFESSVSKTGKSVTIFGTMENNDELLVTYGNKSRSCLQKKISIDIENGCTAIGIDRFSMLNLAATIEKNQHWEDVLEFGLREKIVTSNTAYIVLERVEDYIRYNIEPPKELEEECKIKGYVKRETKSHRQHLKQMDDYDLLNEVVKHYNQRLYAHDPTSSSISLSRKDLLAEEFSALSRGRLATTAASQGNLSINENSESNLSEVVIVGLSREKRSLSYAMTKISGSQLFGSSIGSVVQGKVAGIQVSQSYHLSNPSIVLRGSSAISGSNQPLFVIDGFPFEGNINDIPVVNIHDITVLKSPAATGLYGSRGYHGVIVITTKKFRNSYRVYSSGYKLKNMEDVDYIMEIKQVKKQDKMQRYHELRKMYHNDANFYMDMGQHFFENRLTDEACTVLMNAAEVLPGNEFVLRAIAYTFESWKFFRRSADIYRQLIAINPMQLSNRRDLAWSLYQSGKIHEAVETFYEALKTNTTNESYYNAGIKVAMLSEMNAIIAIHKGSLEFAGIPKALLKPMPVDLRIMISDETGRAYPMLIRKPIERKVNIEAESRRISNDDIRSHYNSFNEYAVKQAAKGKYKIIVNYYANSWEQVPKVLRIMTFKNFGRNGQGIKVENVVMNEQGGEVEIGDVEW